MYSEPAMATAGEAVPDTPSSDAESVLALFDGDAKAAIEALIADRAFLVRELDYASLAMSFGFSRGWKPKVGGLFH